jgi:organic hydroperoxide reductase OsmC/OhrA
VEQISCLADPGGIALQIPLPEMRLPDFRRWRVRRAVSRLALRMHLSNEEAGGEMQEFPHHYAVAASGRTEGDVLLRADRLPGLPSASPAEFDGPGDCWSPETLLAGAVGDCLILTFRAVARASKLSWTSLRCDVTATLDRIDGVTQFTRFDVVAHLNVPAGTNEDLARRALEKAERNCLISNSLKGAIHLVPEIEVAGREVGELVTA